MTTPLMQSMATSSLSKQNQNAAVTSPGGKDSTEYLPEIDITNQNAIQVWDKKYRKICGYLNKKGGSAGGGGFFGNRRNWQKRFFSLEHRIGQHENYLLRYYANPLDKTPKGELSMDGCEVLEDSSKSKTEREFSFQLRVPGRKDLFELHADSDRERQDWIQTVRYVASVASRRGMLMRQRIGTQKATQDEAYREDAPPPPKQKSRSQVLARPQLRLELDVGAVPPGSAERATFVQALQEDVARALFGTGGSRGERSIKVFEIRPAAGMDWLTVVDFDVLLEDGEQGERTAVLQRLEGLVADESSELYLGTVTCQTDSSYVAILQHDESNHEMSVPANKRAIVTPVPRVRSVLEKYMHLSVPEGAQDASKFHVYLVFEGSKKTLWVPSPRTMPRKSCVIWPYEVKDCLGLSGTVQDLWMTPIQLNPSGVPTSLATPLTFTPSDRHGGLPIIDTALMRQGVTYNVVFDDRREDALTDLSPEQNEKIMANFALYDVNGDGCIDRAECMSACQSRTDSSKEAIDLQMEAALANCTTQFEQDEIMEQKKAHYQKVDEAEAALMNMFIKADTDGDGQLSKAEFILAEAWWMKSTLNPTQISLF